MTKFSKTISGCVAAAVMAVSIPAVAGNNSRLVNHNDLDLSSAAGQRMLETRIKGAVRQVCTSTGAFSLAEKMDQRRCAKNAMEKAMPKAERTIARYQEVNRVAANESSAVVGN